MGFVLTRDNLVGVHPEIWAATGEISLTRVEMTKE
jgi:hypothetical protein